MSADNPAFSHPDRQAATKAPDTATNGKVIRTGDLPLDDLRAHPQNPNRGDVDEIARSLEAFGQYRPIVINQDNVILAGHHVWKAAQALGWRTILATQVQANADESLRILLADNRLAEKGEGYDLDRLLQALQATDDLTGTGFDDDFVTALAESIEGPPDLDDLEDEAGGPVRDDDYNTRVSMSLVSQVAEAWAKHRKGYMNDSAALGNLLAKADKLDRAEFE